MVKFNLNFYVKLVKYFILEEKITLRYKSAWKKLTINLKYPSLKCMVWEMIL